MPVTPSILVVWTDRFRVRVVEPSDDVRRRLVNLAQGGLEVLERVLAGTRHEVMERGKLVGGERL